MLYSSHTSYPITLLSTLLLIAMAWPGVAQSTKAGKNKIRNLISKGDSFLEYDPRKAKIEYQKAYDKLQEIEDSVLRADTYRKLGTATYLIGEYPKAITYMQQALDIYDDLQYDSLAAELLSEIGSAYYFGNFDEPEKALDYFQQAYDRFTSLGMYANAQYDANYMGYVHWAAGRKEKALEIHLGCLESFKKMEIPRGIATAASDAAFTLNSLQRYTEALTYSNQALNIAVELKDSLMIIPILNNMGVSHRHLNNMGLAKMYSTQSLEAARRRGLNLRVKEALDNLQATYARDGEYEKAYRTHIEYKRLSDSITNVAQLRKLVQLEEQKEFALRESELRAEQAKKEAIAQATIQAQRIKNRNLLIGLAGLIVIALLLIVAIRTRIKLNQALHQKNKELKASNHLIEDKNKELQTLLEELKATQAKLIQYEKLAALGTLTTGVAHEINNPLNFIQAGLYALEDILPNLPGTRQKLEAFEILDHIRTGMNRINHTVMELNRFSKNSNSQDWVSCDIKLIIENCLLVLQPKINKEKCRINLSFADEDLTLIAHEGSLHQVFANVILNSILAITTQGTIDILAKKTNTEIQVIIIDDGCGMDKETLSQAFDPFFTTRAPGEGMGLGLYVSYKLINSHQGTIELNSLPGKGTTAIITLPLNLKA